MIDFEQLNVMKRHLKKLDMYSDYDTDKLIESLAHTVGQIKYFYCDLVASNKGDEKRTFYKLKCRPKEHQLVYVNIGRGYPKELMDAHWCYILKDFGYKMIVIPATSIKKNSSPLNESFQLNINTVYKRHMSTCRLQLSDIRSIDIQRINPNKGYVDVITDRERIVDFVKRNVF